MMSFEGFCHISQSDFSLTEHDKHAVTVVGPPEHIIWRITRNPGPPGSEQLVIALTSGPLDESDQVPNVLTIGKKTEDEGIQIYLEPLQSPPSKSQLWTLEDVMATKRYPPLAHAKLQSVEFPDLLAGTGVLHRPLPRIYLNVAGAPKDVGNQIWKFDFIPKND